MAMKEAAEQLLVIADEIERDAAEVTQFVCDKCNHTATLVGINGKRLEMAKTAGENVTVAEITVNDKIQCPACEGVMAYRETEASKAYYFDPEKTAEVAPKDPANPDQPEDPSKKPADPVASVRLRFSLISAFCTPRYMGCGWRATSLFNFLLITIVCG